MTPRPLALRQPTLGLVMGGTCTALRRKAGGALKNIEPGDLLWIREPFYLKAQYKHLAPSAAAEFGARPYFAADLKPGDVLREELGKQHASRSLLRIWHRYHLEIIDVERQHIRDITNAEIFAEGFTSRAQYVFAWNAQSATWGGPSWDKNPTVNRIAFRFLGKPVPGMHEHLAAQTSQHEGQHA